MIVQYVACTINMIMIVIDTSQNVIDYSRVALQIVASLIIIIYYCNMFLVQATRLSKGRGEGTEGKREVRLSSGYIRFY